MSYTSVERTQGRFADNFFKQRAVEALDSLYTPIVHHFLWRIVANDLLLMHETIISK